MCRLCRYLHRTCPHFLKCMYRKWDSLHILITTMLPTHTYQKMGICSMEVTTQPTHTYQKKWNDVHRLCVRWCAQPARTFRDTQQQETQQPTHTSRDEMLCLHTYQKCHIYIHTFLKWYVYIQIKNEFLKCYVYIHIKNVIYTYINVMSTYISKSILMCTFIYTISSTVHISGNVISTYISKVSYIHTYQETLRESLLGCYD